MSGLYRPLDTPTPLRDQVYVGLEELILDGLLEPGQHLVESRLASQLNVSRNPVREAIRRLERDGWVEVRPRQGAFVRQPRERELADYFHARLLLEVEAARAAAIRVRTSRGNVSQGVQELEELCKTSAELSEALPDQARDPDAPADQLELRRDYRRTSRRFHMAIAALAESRALTEMQEYVSKRTRWYFSSSQTEQRQARWSEHRDILAAITAGDEDRAGRLMGSHMDRLAELSLAALRQQQVLS